MQLLGGLSAKTFLRDYWQKKPLLIRQAWPNFTPLISQEELAGLSLEEDIESRIIIEQQAQSNYQKNMPPWELKKGPFSEKTYQQLPKSHWTLLIQALDHWLPEAQDILQAFNFIPNWRMDDLMVSYAADGGSVGAHYDYYDVFLLQAEGQREWRIGQFCSEQDPFIAGLPIRLLQEFKETERWLLNPGDMLYLPPALAHYGIARGECMTYSIGFRSPSMSEVAQHLLDELIISADNSQRYQDTTFDAINQPGKITQQALAPIKAMLNHLSHDDALLARTLGNLSTFGKYPELNPEPLEQDEVEACLAHITAQPHKTCYKDEKTRFAYYQQAQHLLFFVQGQAQSYPIEQLELLAYLANQRTYSNQKLASFLSHPTSKQLLSQLICQQHLYWD